MLRLLNDDLIRAVSSRSPQLRGRCIHLRRLRSCRVTLVSTCNSCIRSRDKSFEPVRFANYLDFSLMDLIKSQHRFYLAQEDGRTIPII